jgi:hypothetical protein
MERYLTRIGETLESLAVSHAVAAGSQEVTVTFNFISEHTVLCKSFRHEILYELLAVSQRLEAAENYFMTSFYISTLHQILVV